MHRLRVNLLAKNQWTGIRRNDTTMYGQWAIVSDYLLHYGKVLLSGYDCVQPFQANRHNRNNHPDQQPSSIAC